MYSAQRGIGERAAGKHRKASKDSKQGWGVRAKRAVLSPAWTSAIDSVAHALTALARASVLVAPFSRSRRMSTPASRQNSSFIVRLETADALRRLVAKDCRRCEACALAASSPDNAALESEPPRLLSWAVASNWR